MNSIHRELLQLIRSGITGQPEQLPGGFVPEQLQQLVAAHQVEGLVYEGCMVCKINKNNPQVKKWFQKYYCQILRHEKQMAAIKRLFDAFEREGIDYLPMKGVLLKQLYPAPAARVMGDADILIRQEQYDRIRPIVAALGYEEKPEYYHELPWDSKDLHLELHRSVVPSYHAVEYAYFEYVWDRAVHKQGHCYAMSPEDEYLFNFEHYAKHYRGGGIGIRQLIDLWLCRKNMEFDEQIVRQGLEQLNMLQFHEYTCQLLEVWFEDREPDERTEFMTEFIFASGSFGQIENRQTAMSMMEAKREGSVDQMRSRKIRQMIFPSLDTMKMRYPVLEKAPVLLPIMWPVRWVTAAMFRKKNIQNYGKMLKNTDAKKIQSFDDALRYVGLEYRVDQE